MAVLPDGRRALHLTDTEWRALVQSAKDQGKPIGQLVRELFGEVGRVSIKKTA